MHHNLLRGDGTRRICVSLNRRHTRWGNFSFCFLVEIVPVVSGVDCRCLTLLAPHKTTNTQHPNRYFVEGVEESICVNATSDVWFVIGGFAVVSVGLFIVAVSFRLLLQQKEVRTYSTSSHNNSVVSYDALPR